MSRSGKHGQRGLPYSDGTDAVNRPQTNPLQLIRYRLHNTRNIFFRLRMRTIGQPAHRAAVIMVAYNAVEYNKGAHGLCHDLSLRGVGKRL